MSASTPPPGDRIATFLAELKRRKVTRALLMYGAAAFVVAQAADLLQPAMLLPEWSYRFIILLLVAGFPITLVLAWIFDVTPEGVRREASADGAATSPERGSLASDAGATSKAATSAGATSAGVSTGAGSPGRQVSPGRWTAQRIAAIAGVVLMAGLAGAFALLRDEGGAEADGRERSIAVLPFENLSPDPDNAYFASGIHHEIITQLSRVSELQVISRSSVLRYADGARDMAAIAGELGVGAVLEGSVQRVGSRVRITAQLVDARRDRQLWAQSYDRELSDVFGIQSEVAIDIARSLNAAIGPGERARIERHATNQLPAYDLYLRAMQLYNTGAAENETTIELLRQATQLDPAFAAAWALLSRSYSQRVQVYGFPAEWADSALAVAHHAVSLNGDLAEAHYAVGLASSMLGRIRAADEAGWRAVQLNASDATLYSALARNARTLGRYDDVIRLGRRITELDPLNAHGPHHVGTAYVFLGDWDAAQQWLQRSLAVGSTHPAARFSRVYLDLLRGDRAAAESQTLAWLEQEPGSVQALWAAADVALHGGDPAVAARYYAQIERGGRGASQPQLYVSSTALLATALHAAGDRQAAGPLLASAASGVQAAISRGNEAPGLRYELAMIAALRGDREDAYRWLDEAVAGGWRVSALMRTSPAFASLRSEPRFASLLATIDSDLAAQRARVTAATAR
jgi:TolB-like protein/Flp pilus assembly protein TadD